LSLGDLRKPLLSLNISICCCIGVSPIDIFLTGVSSSATMGDLFGECKDFSSKF